jgi:hypothetical protein
MSIRPNALIGTGGFAGNPRVTPLIRESDAHDTILVQIISLAFTIKREELRS